MKQSDLYFKAADEMMSQALYAFEHGFFGEAVRLMGNCHDARSKGEYYREMERLSKYVEPMEQRIRDFRRWLESDERI